MDTDIKSKKQIKRKEYNLIRHTNSSLIHEKIKHNVKSSLKILSSKYNIEEKHIGIYWPLKGEVDIRFIKKIHNHNTALPSSCKSKGIEYHHWAHDQLKLDSNGIPSPVGKSSLKPNEISILLKKM